MGLVKDFRDFALKGNVIDLAIGVIIGAAFGKIVSSLVEDILMPPLGFITGKIDFTKLALTLYKGETAADNVVIRYGNFLQISIQFLIVAFVIFMIVQAIARMERNKEAALDATPSVPEASAQEKLLAEIRDLLRARN